MSSIQWIDANIRVPDNRREVLTWGRSRGFRSREPEFLGVTRYNKAADGGGLFDIERGGYFPIDVTHWAEIEGPDE
jgi:hypothetical protein